MKSTRYYQTVSFSLPKSFISLNVEYIDGTIKVNPKPASILSSGRKTVESGTVNRLMKKIHVLLEQIDDVIVSGI